MIIVIDYGMGNIRSVANMVKKAGFSCVVSNDVELISKAEFIILPGVGNFKQGMKNLKEREMFEVLNNKVLEERTPILGICLGMQLMANHSEEGNVDGFSWVSADIHKFPKELDGNKLVIPNVGWRQIEETIESNILVNMPHNKARFYFVHSYYMQLLETELDCTWLECDYHFKYCCGFIKDNIIGVQFHPEKSHIYGMKFFQNIFRRFLDAN